MNMKKIGSLGVAAFLVGGVLAGANDGMKYLYSAEEKIASPHPFEISAHPYLSDGRRIVAAGAGETVGPLAPGSYLIRETLAPGKVRTRYLGVAAPGWTVLQLTSGSTGDRLDAVVHARRVPMNYYIGIDEAQQDTTLLGWERDYGDDILLHLHPDSLGKVDPKFKTLKENWEDFTVPEIADRLKALDAWMQGFGFKPLRGFASYTPANTLIEAMRAVGWDILHSIVPEQNWSDGNWAINHWGMPNQPFYIGADDFRKSVARGSCGPDVLGMTMNSYHLYMPHVVMWGDNVCSPSHFMRWHRTVDGGDEPVRYENFYEDYLTVASGLTDSPYFLTTGYEFGRSFGTRSMTVHNRVGCEYAIDRARDGAKIVFATASDVADWYKRFCPAPPENVFTQRDYLAGTRIMDKPIDSGPSVAMEMADYKACFDHLSPLPFYHYDYTIPWRFKAADTSAPHDFAAEDKERVKVETEGQGGSRTVRVTAAKALDRVTPVCLWDLELAERPAGVRVFTPPVLDDGRKHTVVELPKGFSGSLALACRVTGAPDKAEFGGLVTPLWRVQTIGAGARRHCYAFADTPLLSPCTVRFTCPKDCRIDSLEKPLGAFKRGDVVELAFTTRRTWYRFWGLTAAELQPDAEGVAALERAAAEWKAFSADAAANLAKVHAEDDAFFASVIPKGERLVLDVDCFGNAVFGERSRARAFDRCVYAANGRVTAREYSDGGISLGRGKSYWVHPRGLTFKIEGLDSLGLKPTDKLRVRLCTVAEPDEPLSYLLTVKSGWNKILGNFVSPADLGYNANVSGEKIVWNPPKTRTAEGLMAFDVPADKIQDGAVSVGLRTNQKQVLDDWYADGGFIARLERVVVTVVPAGAAEASFADFDRRARAGENLSVVFFGGSLTWSANASEPNRTGFRGLMAKYLAEKYPRAHFNFVDASIGGTGSNLGMFRLERDVLSAKPDLVFLDFSCNDGGENTDVANTCCYEYLLREMIGRGIPVQQMYFTFRDWTRPGAVPAKVHPRRDVYWQLAKAYGTPVGDVYATDLWKRMNAGEVPLASIWPVDGGHPCDAGYRMFADAGVAGFERALREGAVCRVPAKPVFGTVKDVRRWNPVDGALPDGWSRKLTYRTSLWYDGLSSRWMGDVAAFAGKERSPLEVSATGNFFGVFGDADEHALTAEIRADGKKVASFRGYHGAGPGRLFIWRTAKLDGWSDGVSRQHAFSVDPIPSENAKAAFRIGSVCTATLVPSAPSAAGPGANGDAALEKLDHARGN